jgi:glutaredoxin
VVRGVWLCQGETLAPGHGSVGTFLKRIPSVDNRGEEREGSYMNITAYLKPHCGWSNGVRAIFKKYGLEYEDRDIINNPANYAEMVQKSGQPLSPCVEIDGVMLADVSGEEVENYLLSNELVQPNEQAPDSPIDRACSDEEHERMRQNQTIRFF